MFQCVAEFGSIAVCCSVLLRADFCYTQTELEAELSTLKEEHLLAADLASQASEVCVRERVRERERERQREVKERKKKRARGRETSSV